jgi:hypothetical protein
MWTMFLGTMREAPEERQRAFYLRSTSFHDLFLNMISCFLWLKFPFNVGDMFILVRCQIIPLEPNMVSVPGIWIWPSPCLHTSLDIIYSAMQLCLNWTVLRKFWESAVLLIFSVWLLKFIYIFYWPRLSGWKQWSLDHSFLCSIHV